MADGVDFLGFDRLISELEQMGLRGEKIEDKALAAAVDISSVAILWW
ncbi:hypothetical protein [Bacillus thuringiensis]